MYLFGHQLKPCANGLGNFHAIYKCRETSGDEIRKHTSVETSRNLFLFVRAHAPRSYEDNDSTEGSHRIGNKNI